MMNKTGFIVLAACLLPSPGHGGEHHSGHGGGALGRGQAGGHCLKAHLSRFSPPHLATVRPGGEFSFVVANLDDPKRLAVTVKGEPVAVSAEFKDPHHLVSGQLPAHLRGTMARIQVKAWARQPGCEVEGGWLLNISAE